MNDRLENVALHDILVLRCGGKLTVHGVYEHLYTYSFKGCAGTYTWWNGDWSGFGRDGKFRNADPHPMDVMEVIKAAPNLMTLRERINNAIEAFRKKEKP